MTNRICTKTVLDTTIPGIQFDADGVSHYCTLFKEMEARYPLGEQGKIAFDALVARIKARGAGKRYDCIVGVSGGTDSSYTLYQAVLAGLRPLAVHLDNGWNSNIAVNNIRKVCSKLNVDLETYVIDWEEFKDLQLSFLKASVSDGEIPTDVAIHATLIRSAAREGVSYVLNGHSFRTEFMMPIGWTYMDGRYIRSVHALFGKHPLKTFPNFNLHDVAWYNLIRGIKVIPFLNFFDYQKEKAQEVLTSELGWENYGGHHHESIYTKFFQSYYLPRKFGIDKRKTKLSAMILSGFITREKALEILKEPYTCDAETIEFVLHKLSLSQAAFDELMKAPKRSFQEYKTYYPLILALRLPIWFACQLGVLPELLYYKFFKISS